TRANSGEGVQQRCLVFYRRKRRYMQPSASVVRGRRGMEQLSVDGQRRKVQPIPRDMAACELDQHPRAGGYGRGESQAGADLESLPGDALVAVADIAQRNQLAAGQADNGRNAEEATGHCSEQAALGGPEGVQDVESSAVVL